MVRRLILCFVEWRLDTPKTSSEFYLQTCATWSYNGNMSRYSKLIAAAGMVALTLTAAPAPAHAEPCATDALGRPIEHWPPGCTVTAPTTTAPSTSGSSGGGGITDWIGDHGPLLIGIGLAIFAVAVWRSMAREKAEAKQKLESAAVARGRAIAMDAGVEPAASSPADLQRYSTFGWAVPWQPGTAFGNLVDRDGGTARVHAAWVEAAELARLGHVDEMGAFTPAADVVNVNGYADGTGDLELAVSTRDYSIGETQLNKVLDHLVRTARVETASTWTRDAVRDWHVTRLSMIPAAVQQAPAPEQPQQAPDPTEKWEW